MRFAAVVLGMAAAASLVSARLAPVARSDAVPIAPQVMLVSMFNMEANVWPDQIRQAGLGDLHEVAVRVPGLSPLFPSVFCCGNYSVCHVVVTMGEINAAASMMALVTSPRFDLAQTYFLLGGIAGVSPRHGTLGTVALARYAVQVALQFEMDAREKPANFSSGYFAIGTTAPDQYPTITYGTEVMEVNVGLRDAAAQLASRATLMDSAGAQRQRAAYAGLGAAYAAATAPPSVVRCDAATSDVYYTGALLSETFENTTQVWTNGTGVYCMTAQEDSAVLAVLVRAAIDNLADFERVILMRTGSDFDRPPPGETAYQHLVHADQSGFDIALANIGRAGIEIVKGIIAQWDEKYAAGIAPTNYVGDILGSLRGMPDYGLGSVTGGKGFAAVWAAASNSDTASAAPITPPLSTSCGSRRAKSLLTMSNLSRYIWA